MSRYPYYAQTFCSWCGIAFWKRAAELKRQIADGRLRWFCSNVCAGKDQGWRNSRTRERHKH